MPDVYPSQAAEYGSEQLMAMAGTLAEAAEDGKPGRTEDRAERVRIAAVYAQMSTTAAIREQSEAIQEQTDTLRGEQETGPESREDATPCRTCKGTRYITTVESGGESAYTELCPDCGSSDLGLAEVVISGATNLPDVEYSVTHTVTLDVARLVERVLAREDVAGALDYILSVHEGGPSCGCGGEHWACTFPDQAEEGGW
jgi:hypothetical protein